MTEKQANRLFDLTNVVLITLAVIVCIAPFIHIIAISLSSSRAIMSGEVTLLPIEVTWEAYKRVFTDASMLRSLGFTMYLTVITTILSMIMTILAAYPLAKSSLRWKSLIMFFIVITMFFSGGMIPEYLLVRDLGLINTTWSLVLPNLISPFFLIILITFFKGIPDSLEEAADVDGSSHFRTLFSIVLPLSAPVMATLSLFYAVNRWNGFQDTLMYITNPNLYPLQLKLYQIVSNAQASDLLRSEGVGMFEIMPEGLKAASVIFATVPILLVYPWLQRYFVNGTMVGAVKG
ncbi:carbohydrate ABC transporter permease [Paenibacillus daejeonensis]|uniref:carbohydrate ABC transporter permease n=1 Tax=Paenibacillus daejeonensis TaxID=135193 RepID=UPI000373C4AE|nr:carbohydrate ABC transporter permease [Paenibacillus daejeonensis]